MIEIHNHKTQVLLSTLVNGTIVLCDQLDDGEGALGAGAIGTIMRDSGFEDVAFSFPLSTSYITLSDGSSVAAYINSTGYIFVDNLQIF